MRALICITDSSMICYLKRMKTITLGCLIKARLKEVSQAGVFLKVKTCSNELFIIFIYIAIFKG